MSLFVVAAVVVEEARVLLALALTDLVVKLFLQLYRQLLAHLLLTQLAQVAHLETTCQTAVALGELLLLQVQLLPLVAMVDLNLAQQEKSVLTILAQ
jgi:hypothetical protein